MSSPVAKSRILLLPIFHMSCFCFIGSTTTTTKSSTAAAEDIDIVSEGSAAECFSELPFDPEPEGQASGLQKLFNEAVNLQDKLVAVVVTISADFSYDANFREVKPETVPGERVSTYAVSLHDAAKLLDLLCGGQAAELAEPGWRELLDDINSVAADSVTFNWECCGACGPHGFGRGRRRGIGPSATMQLVGHALQRGFTVMVSDFSLKALLSEWSEELLGANPFVNLPSSCNHQFQLDFFPEHLKNDEVPQQLQVVGELCATDGRAVVSAMGDTIVYTINPKRPQTDAYQLQVLTVVSSWSGGGSVPEAMKCEIEHNGSSKRGVAGHVTLTYPSGGQLVTSMGHWIELTRINTSVESLMQAAAHNFGEEEVYQHRQELSQMRTETERQVCLQKLSKQMIQKSVPTRMKARTKY